MEHGPQYISTPPLPPQSHTVCIFCTLGKGGGGSRSERRYSRGAKYSSFVHGGNSSQAGSKILTNEWMYLQSVKSVENLPQTPFTGQFKRKADIKGLCLYNSIVSDIAYPGISLSFHSNLSILFLQRNHWQSDIVALTSLHRSSDWGADALSSLAQGK
jgi:hypothetical protein